VNGVPTLGKNIAQNRVYTLDFFDTPTTTTSTFNESLSLTINYSDDDVVGMDESTLKIYRYDGSVWSELPNCSVDTNLNTITCETDKFSTFVIGGDDSPSGGSGSGSGGGSSGGGGGGSSSGSSSGGGTTLPIIPTTLPAYQITSNLWRGVKGQDVIALQTLLVKLGYTTADNITGYYGVITEASVKAFQKDHGIVSSGSPLSTGYGAVGPKTRAQVNLYLSTGLYTGSNLPVPNTSPSSAKGKLTTNLWRGLKGGEVLILQNFFLSIGYITADNVTGFYGTVTEEAVKRFQRENGIVSSGDALSTGYGAVGPKTRARLNEVGM
jgi:peptidoglycan hydrolase-like protein with peptidoglycan-binding domain